MNVIFNKSVFTQEFCDLCTPLGRKIALFAAASLSHAPKLLAFLQRQGFQAELFSLPDGEAAKTREIKQLLENQLLEKQYGRDSLFLSLGGGAVSDVIGFLASTYLRGVALILLPTTLLAMADASLGGKTGVDTPHGKNLIGTTYQPHAVWMDYSFLDSLPESEWFNGLAEVIKSGLIGNPSIFELLEEHGFDPKDKAAIAALIEKTASFKLRVVQKDPKEQSIRAILNFGHTVAHAIEQASDYTWPHGKAVAAGIVAESYLSHKLGYLSTSDLDRIIHLIISLGYPLGPLPSSLLEPMRADKKNLSGKIHFVLLKKIGETVSSCNIYSHPVEEVHIFAMLQWLSNRST